MLHAGLMCSVGGRITINSPCAAASAVRCTLQLSESHVLVHFGAVQAAARLQPS
jgi:hypothetical protein